MEERDPGGTEVGTFMYTVHGDPSGDAVLQVVAVLGGHESVEFSNDEHQCGKCSAAG